MSSIVFNGNDFSDYTTCTVDEAAQWVVPTTKEIPGRAGALLLSGRVPPRVLKVRLYLDPRYKPDVGSMSELRHLIYGWLGATEGAMLEVPGDPTLEWHDVICTSASGWTTNEEDASCEVEFTCFDPIAYGASCIEDETTFQVGGTWPTWPTFELTASAGSSVQVVKGAKAILVQHAFAGGETVVIDCEAETVTINGVDARTEVALASDFFRLEPGGCELAYVGCSAYAASYRERWL